MIGASTGEVQSTGETSEQDDGEDKGCACATDAGSRDLGALVIMALGLGLAGQGRAARELFRPGAGVERPAREA